MSKVLNYTPKYFTEIELTVYLKCSFDAKSLASLSMRTTVQDTSFPLFFKQLFSIIYINFIVKRLKPHPFQKQAELPMAPL